MASCCPAVPSCSEKSHNLPLSYQGPEVWPTSDDRVSFQQSPPWSYRAPETSPHSAQNTAGTTPQLQLLRKSKKGMYWRHANSTINVAPFSLLYITSVSCIPLIFFSGSQECLILRWILVWLHTKDDVSFLNADFRQGLIPLLGKAPPHSSFRQVCTLKLFEEVVINPAQLSTLTPEKKKKSEMCWTVSLERICQWAFLKGTKKRNRPQQNCFRLKKSINCNKRLVCLPRIFQNLQLFNSCLKSPTEWDRYRSFLGGNPQKISTKYDFSTQDSRVEIPSSLLHPAHNYYWWCQLVIRLFPRYCYQLLLIPRCKSLASICHGNIPTLKPHLPPVL